MNKPLPVRSRWLLAIGMLAFLIVLGWRGQVWLESATALETRYVSDSAALHSIARTAVEAYQRIKGAIYFDQLAEDLTVGARTDRERVQRLLEWTYLHVRSPFCAPTTVVADDSYRIVKRGFGYCDQSGHVFATLAHEAGFPARLFLLRDDRDGSPHTVAQVFVDGEWIFVDALFGFVLEVNGEPITLEDIRRTPELVAAAYEAVPPTMLRVSAGDFLRGTSYTTFPYGGLEPFKRRIVTLWP